MNYAVNNNGKSWRAVASEADVSPNETFSLTEPVLVPAETELMQAELDNFRADRREMFAVISGMGFAAIATNDNATRDALVVFREGVKDLPEWPAVANATTHAGLKTAMKNRYKTLTDALPAAIRADFKKLSS